MPCNRCKMTCSHQITAQKIRKFRSPVQITTFLKKDRRYRSRLTKRSSPLPILQKPESKTCFLLRAQWDPMPASILRVSLTCFLTLQKKAGHQQPDQYPRSLFTQGVISGKVVCTADLQFLIILEKRDQEYARFNDLIVCPMLRRLSNAGFIFPENSCYENPF